MPLNDCNLKSISDIVSCLILIIRFMYAIKFKIKSNFTLNYVSFLTLNTTFILILSIKTCVKLLRVVENRSSTQKSNFLVTMHC